MAAVSIAALIGPPIDGAFLSHYTGFTQVEAFCGVVVLAGSVLIFLAKQTTGKGLLGKI